jgi:curved DNA-binding protein
MRNYYDDLGVGEEATDAQIKSAYRKLAKEHHPDRSGGNSERFKQVSEAHEVLSDDNKRQEYDQMRRYGHPGMGGGHPGGNYSDFGDFGDIFSSIFGDFSNGQQQARNPIARKGRDGRVQVEIPFNTAILGGQISIANANDKRLTVTIPEGVVDGSHLRLKGQGHPGQNGGPDGDLMVEIKVSTHPDFRREGRNLVSNLHVNYIDLILGIECSVETLHGEVMLKVPPGLGNGARLRIGGYGVRGNGKPGDHFVVIRPDMPKDISKEEKKLLMKLRDIKNKEGHKDD